MRLTTDTKKVTRIAVLALSAAGLLVAVAAFLRFVRAVAGNALEGGPALNGHPEYYRQVGAYYGRGFITGFFVCYFLMLIAMIVGSWVDERLRARRAARAAAPEDPAVAAVPAGTVVPD